MRRESAPHRSATSAAGSKGQVQVNSTSEDEEGCDKVRMAEVKFDGWWTMQREEAVAAAPEAVTPAQPNNKARILSALRSLSKRAARGVMTRPAANTDAPKPHATANFAGSLEMSRGIRAAAEVIFARPAGDEAVAMNNAHRS